MVKQLSPAAAVMNWFLNFARYFVDEWSESNVQNKTDETPYNKLLDKCHVKTKKFSDGVLKMADDEAVQLLFFDTFPHEVNEVKLLFMNKIKHSFKGYQTAN